ncbi:MAG: AAA family ATPase [Gammaproteobacteria bacterium]|nr:AAA family ATPase [Gammaproteobacteria bacterium]
MQKMVKVALSDDFLRAFAAIPRDRQQSVVKFMATFRQNPMSPGINYEKINDAADPRMRSVRIGIDYRGIVLKPDQGDVYCLLWVDKHDDAYDWARRHKVAIHPEVGTIQVLESSRGEVVAPEGTRAAQEDLFASLKDRELLRLGVPQELVQRVRSIVTVEQLEASHTGLPDDAFEALYLFAAGESYESLVREREAPAQVDTEDFAGALERDGSKRHFLVITDDLDLEAILAEPLARWRVFLHPSQRKLVERDWNGPVRVLGGAGTGKTVAAMHRAVWLARKLADVPGKPVLFTTYTRTLADDIRSQVASITTPAERDRIEVANIDQWALSVLRRAGYRHELLFDGAKRRELWTRALTRKPDGEPYPDPFYQAEFERVILPQGCESVDDYLRASRVGRGRQLSRSARRALWPVFAEYRAQLRSANLREPEEAYRDALAILKREGTSLGIRSIVVDEAQDLSPQALALLRAAVPEGPNDLFIVGDAHQRIYRHKVALSRVGIDIRGRGRKLRVNYRTTDEIRKWAVAQLANCTIDDLDGQPDALVGYQSLSHGPMPESVNSASRAEERSVIEAAIDRLKADGIPMRSVCLVTRTNAEANEYAQWLHSTGRETLKLDRGTPDDQDKAGVRVATMHRVKGLEFDAVILAGYRTPEHYAKEYGEEEDAGVMLDNLTSERCLLHVAATRAKRYLMVSRIQR